MPSFDVVSEVAANEITNAVDQANRELSTRFDFRGVNAKFKQIDNQVELAADAEIQLQQMVDILKAKLVKRSIDVACLDIGDIEGRGKQLIQSATIREGLEIDLCRKIVKQIKTSKIKVQSAIQGEKVRVTGKKRDDLQQVMALLKESDIDMPLQFNNFRD